MLVDNFCSEIEGSFSGWSKGIFVVNLGLIFFLKIYTCGCGIARVGASTCLKKWQPFQCFVAFWSGKKCSQKRSFFLDFATLTAQISDLFCLATFIDHCACRPLRFFSWGQDTKRFPNAIARIECIDRSWHWNHHPFLYRLRTALLPYTTSKLSQCHPCARTAFVHGGETEARIAPCCDSKIYAKGSCGGTTSNRPAPHQKSNRFFQSQASWSAPHLQTPFLWFCRKTPAEACRRICCPHPSSGTGWSCECHAAAHQSTACTATLSSQEAQTFWRSYRPLRAVLRVFGSVVSSGHTELLHSRGLAPAFGQRCWLDLKLAYCEQFLRWKACCWPQTSAAWMSSSGQWAIANTAKR